MSNNEKLQVATFRGEHHVFFVDSDYDVLCVELRDERDDFDPSEIVVHDAATCTRNYDVINRGLRSIESVVARVGFDDNTCSGHLELRQNHNDSEATLYFQRDETTWWLPVMPVEFLEPVEIKVWATLLNREHLDETAMLREVNTQIEDFINFARVKWGYKEPKVI